jgi:hypothetical protein
MNRLLLLFLALQLCRCETSSFDKDKRQIAAKNEIKALLPPASRSFDIINFREDTITTGQDSTLKTSIRYSLDFIYKDSAGVSQERTGHVLFTPDGKSILGSNITKRDQ